MSQRGRFAPLNESSKLYGSSPSEEPNKRDESKAMFDIRSWHRPYAKALLETDPAKLEALIREAEIAILGRFLEPSACSIQMDESLDLQNAVEALSQLKKASAVGHARHRL
jgi:hypothetical protein